MSHLWEVDHPYYCIHGEHNVYESWADFHAEWGAADTDMNLVFRWDWYRDDAGEAAEEPEPDKLKVFWLLQRKGIFQSTECVVAAEDEPAVRAWLEERAKTIAAIWAPLTLVHRDYQAAGESHE